MILEGVGDDGLDKFWGKVYQRKASGKGKGPLEISGPKEKEQGQNGESSDSMANELLTEQGSGSNEY